MGGEGGGQSGEEAEEETGCHRVAGEGLGQSRTAIRLCYNSQISRRAITSERRKRLNELNR